MSILSDVAAWERAERERKWRAAVEARRREEAAREAALRAAEYGRLADLGCRCAACGAPSPAVLCGACEPGPVPRVRTDRRWNRRPLEVMAARRERQMRRED